MAGGRTVEPVRSVRWPWQFVHRFLAADEDA